MFGRWMNKNNMEPSSSSSNKKGGKGGNTGGGANKERKPGADLSKPQQQQQQKKSSSSPQGGATTKEGPPQQQQKQNDDGLVGGVTTKPVPIQAGVSKRSEAVTVGDLGAALATSSADDKNNTSCSQVPLLNIDGATSPIVITTTSSSPQLALSASPPKRHLPAIPDLLSMDDDLDLPVILDPKVPSKILQVPKPEKQQQQQKQKQQQPTKEPPKKEPAKKEPPKKNTQNGTHNVKLMNGTLKVNPSHSDRAPSPQQAAVVAALGKSLNEGQENGVGAEDPAMESPTMDQVLRDEANFIQNVSQFYNQEALSDVVLKVGEERYFSHRFVLAKSSEYFRTMLYEHGWNQQTQAEVELEETPECQVVFDKFLRYLYTAEISISTMSAVGILCLADKYFVTSLKELCCKYMIENSRSPKVRNALTWYSWAKALHLEPLIEQCTKTISWNFSEIISAPEWVNMDVEFVFDMFSNCELVVSNEFSLWNALSSWLLQESRLRDLPEHGARLLPLIRFPQMLVSQLYELEQGELAQREECKQLLHGLLSRAYRFRSLCPAQQLLSVSFGDKFYTPRDYIDLTVDNVRIQNTLRFGIQVDVKMYRGPVPSETREGDWKITYRKQIESWALQLYCHESAMINGEARIMASIIIYNDQEKVIQVHQEPSMLITRGSTVTITMVMQNPQIARNMAVLIKPTAV